MSRCLLVIALVACGGKASAPAEDVIETRVVVGKLSYVFRSSYVGNLTFELDCLASLVPCSTEAFTAMWHVRGWTDADTKALATWSEVRSRYTGTIVDDTEPAVPSPLPMPHRTLFVATSLRLAGFGARSIDEYLGRIALIATPADVARARGVLEHFGPRARTIWREHRAELAAAADGYATLAARADLAVLMTKVTTFYSAELPEHQVFELVLRPPHLSSTLAEHLGPLGIVEVTQGESPTRQFPVVAHEMFHSWFASSPIAKQFDLSSRFAKAGDPLAGPAYGLFDEVIATTLGNGLVQRAVEPAEYARLLTQPGGLYDDPLIDAGAKALVGELDAWLARDKTIFDPDFVPLYLRAVHTAFPKGLPPIAYLRPLAIATQDDLAKSTEHLSTRSSSGVVLASSAPAEAREILETHTAWGRVLLVTPPKLETLDLVDDETLLVLRGLKPPFVLTLPRTDIGVLFIFVAADDAAMIELIDAFADETKLRPGVFAPAHR